MSNPQNKEMSVKQLRAALRKLFDEVRGRVNYRSIDRIERQIERGQRATLDNLMEELLPLRPQPVARPVRQLKMDEASIKRREKYAANVAKKKQEAANASWKYAPLVPTSFEPNLVQYHRIYPEGIVDRETIVRDWIGHGQPDTNIVMNQFDRRWINNTNLRISVLARIRIMLKKTSDPKDPDDRPHSYERYATFSKTYDGPIRDNGLVEGKPYNLVSFTIDGIESNVEDYDHVHGWCIDTLMFTVIPSIDAANIRMRDAAAPNLEGLDGWSWDTKTGHCVFDFIIHRYYTTARRKVQWCKSYESILEVLAPSGCCDCGNCDDCDLPQSIMRKHVAAKVRKMLFDNGLNVKDCKIIAEALSVPMIALDLSENVICSFEPNVRSRDNKTLCFIVSNAHMYPITDSDRIKALQTQNNGTARYQHSETKESDMDIVHLESDGFKSVVKRIMDSNTMPTKVCIRDGSIRSFDADNTRYKFISETDVNTFKAIHESIYKYWVDDDEYRGEGLSNMSLSIFNECFKKSAELNGNKAFAHHGALISEFNHHVFDSLQQAKGKIKTGYLKPFWDARAFDISKCYTSCLLEPEEDLYLFNFKCAWEDTESVHDNAFHFVYTPDQTLLCGDNVYSSSILRMAQSEGIYFQVIAVLKPFCTIPRKIMADAINLMKTPIGGTDVKLTKLLINTLIGSLGITHHSGVDCKVTTDQMEAFYFASKMQSPYVHQIGQFHLFGNIRTNEIIKDSGLGIYLQVKDFANMRLYRLAKYLESLGGEVVGYKTDCVVVTGLEGEVKCDNKAYGGFGECNVPKLRSPYRPKIGKFEAIDGAELHDITSSNNWADIKTVIDTHGGLCIAGKAGTGKSYVIKQLSSAYEAEGVKVHRLAYTHTAAINIDGQTIHSFFRICSEDARASHSGYSRDDVIIVDEFSMIPELLWKVLINVTCKIVVVGDPAQVPPVDGDFDWILHPDVRNLYSNQLVVLDQTFRYDESLSKAADVIEFESQHNLETKVNICYLNSTRMIVNKHWNEKLKTESAQFIANKWLYPGCPLIANCTTTNFVNNEQFIVKSIGNRIELENATTELTLKKSDLEKFDLAYCITTHKAQGATISEPFTIYDWNMMTPRLRYTAMTRAKSLRQLRKGDVNKL